MELYAVPTARSTLPQEHRLERSRSPWAAPVVVRRGRSVSGGPEPNPLVRAAEDELQQADAGVRAHEAAHIAAAGAAASGGASYIYMRGPDGRMYAVGGSVSVNMSPVPGDPEATIRKARVLIQAAYAVGQPSAADLRVAAEAYEMEMQAQREMERSKDRQTERGSGGEIAVA